MRLSSQQVYDKLVNEDKVLELEGQIRFYFGDVDIVVKAERCSWKYHTGMVKRLA